LSRLWANVEIITGKIEEEAAQLVDQARACLRVIGGIPTAVSTPPDEWEQQAASLIPSTDGFVFSFGL
jgi:hypothetical protein